ncbi:MAG: TetR/AcrR family transcriptional regulator [Planctomycetes bacterium]|nr:TetR/AcrR family transcriptional regulator [Planctomycetota bacterium]
MGRPRLDPNLAPTRARLIEAAAKEFASEGYAGARLARIAAGVGIRRPSLLYHFSTKEGLYAAVIHTVFRRLDAALQRAFSLEGEFSIQLDAVTRGYLHFLDEEPTFAPLLIRELLDGQGPGQALIREELLPLLDTVERFFASSPSLRSGTPIRSSLLAIAASGLLRSVSGELREPLWGVGSSKLPALAAFLLLAQEPSL